MNQLRTLQPYKYNGWWVFDDPTTGLDKEPFVLDIDTMIDALVGGIPDANKGFNLLFSTEEFPGYDVKLQWVREELGGNWYYCDKVGIEGWLCPALYRYFDKAPDSIYVKVFPLIL